MEHKGSHSRFDRELTKFKIIKLYSIAILTISHIDSQVSLGTILDYLLLYTIPWKLRGHGIYQLFYSTGVMGDLFYSKIYHSNSVPCFITSE